MTDFIGVKGMLRLLANTSVEGLLGRMAAYIEEDFRRWPQFDKSPRVASHTPFGVIELMPTSDMETYAFKYVNGHPSNPARGYQTVTAFGVLADVHNGYPVFMAEMTILTALRTAATSALVARRLARPDATRMALIGAGSQAEFQALAFRALLGIDSLSVWDVDPAATEKLRRNLVPLGFSVRVAVSAADAAMGADIITTCTADKAQATILDHADVSPGTHINAIGGDCPGKTELDRSLVESGTVFVEYLPQTRIEGEIQQLAPDSPATEIWEVLAGHARGRSRDDEITIFDSVGFAIEDFSALRFLRDETVGKDVVSTLDLVADPSDPKDLFGMITSLVPAG